MNQCKTGRSAEQLAARYLRARAYRIMKTNWRWGRKELDLVAIHKGELVIVEVKSMVGNRVNHPSEVVDLKKQRNIILAAEGYIRIHNWHGPTRFDVIGVYYGNEGVEFEHIENAFNPQME